ncbi:uncharacterized protein LOC130998760 [Salvia miltiorrhiza]|uniref:uncharacterized protein LOC130998760 n=1 Tax=Salvia miltiorrhiza TaxID=226208 RepID=UPI0025AD12B2|nr:uncharacterized protein LOC130998760 [Salvia miltiorrhiza]
MVEELDSENNFAGCFARFKVNFDVTVPLLRGITIAFEGKQLWVPLKYENLPIFCYRCGLMGHHIRACDKERDEDENGRHFEDLLYGPILKASPLKRLRTPRQATSPPRKFNPPNAKHPTSNLPTKTQTIILSHNNARKPRPPPLSFNPIIEPKPKYPCFTPDDSNLSPAKDSHNLKLKSFDSISNTNLKTTTVTQKSSQPSASYDTTNPNITPIADIMEFLKIQPTSTSIPPISTPTPMPNPVTMQAPFNPAKNPTDPVTRPNAQTQPLTPLLPYTEIQPAGKPSKKWKRCARISTSTSTNTAQVPNHDKKRHLREEESDVTIVKQEALTSTHKRSRGGSTVLPTPSTASSAEIASVQSRRAQ